nr:MAG TPA: hypothetical protein [Bacteriophage sp.]DAW99030.1 MAG TPA: hypothetical protein [Bacteriophage sp.]
MFQGFLIFRQCLSYLKIIMNFPFFTKRSGEYDRIQGVF